MAFTHWLRSSSLEVMAVRLLDGRKMENFAPTWLSAGEAASLAASSILSHDRRPKTLAPLLDTARVTAEHRNRTERT